MCQWFGKFMFGAIKKAHVATARCMTHDPQSQLVLAMKRTMGLLKKLHLYVNSFRRIVHKMFLGAVSDLDLCTTLHLCISVLSGVVLTFGNFSSKWGQDTSLVKS